MTDNLNLPPGQTPPPPPPPPSGPPAGGAAGFSLDAAFDLNVVPEAQRPLFAEAKLGKWSDVLNFAADAATRAKAPVAFSKDMKFDPGVFGPEAAKIFSAKKIETVEGLADLAINGQKRIGMLGDNPLPRPQAGKVGEWLASNAEALGKPAKPEDYAWNKPTMPEGMVFDEAKEAAFRKFAHERHLPGEMFQDFADFGANLLMQDAQNRQVELQVETDKARDELKKEWGNDYRQKQEVALFAARNLALPDDLIDKLSGENGGPHTLRLLAALGAKMEGASTINGDGTGAANTKAAAQQQLQARASNKDLEDAFQNGNHPQHAFEVQERERLNKIIHGS